jgi:hypothetical protein
MKNVKYISTYCLILLFTIFSSIDLKAQEEVPELVTDRPDQTESSVTVPTRSVQLETGFVYAFDETKEEKIKDFAYNTSLLRFGVLKNLELRFAFAYLGLNSENLETNEVTKVDGWASMNVGIKIFITEEKGWIPELAFLGFFDIPKSGNSEFDIPFTGPGFRVAATHTLSDNLSFGYNLGANWDGENPNTNWYYSVVLGASAGERWGFFAEVYGYIIEQSTPVHMADGGLTFLILHNLQFDISAGLGLNEKAPDGFVSTGVSWRFPQ